MLRDADGRARSWLAMHPLADLVCLRDVVSPRDPRTDLHGRGGRRQARVALGATMIDDFPPPLPDDLGRDCQTAGLDPDASIDLAARRTGRALPVGWRKRSPTSTAPPPSRISGRAARSRAAVCTAPTGSRPTRCSTVSCSAGASSPRSRRARTRAESTRQARWPACSRCSLRRIDPTPTVGGPRSLAAQGSASRSPEALRTARCNATMSRRLQVSCAIRARACRWRARDALRRISPLPRRRPARPREIAKLRRSSTCLRVLPMTIVAAALARARSRSGAHPRRTCPDSRTTRGSGRLVVHEQRRV